MLIDPTERNILIIDDAIRCQSPQSFAHIATAVNAYISGMEANRFAAKTFSLSIITGEL